MKLIGNLDKLKTDVFAYRVYDKLKTLLIEDEESLLYYMFPIYSANIDVGKIQATLLLLSPLYGIFYFDTVRTEEDIDIAQQRINDLYDCIVACFRKCPSLKSGRNSLKYDIVTVLVTDEKTTVSPDFINVSHEELNTIFKEYNVIDKNDFNLIQSCLEGTIQAKKQIVR